MVDTLQQTRIGSFARQIKWWALACGLTLVLAAVSLVNAVVAGFPSLVLLAPVAALVTVMWATGSKVAGPSHTLVVGLLLLHMGVEATRWFGILPVLAMWFTSISVALAEEVLFRIQAMLLIAGARMRAGVLLLLFPLFLLGHAGRSVELTVDIVVFSIILTLLAWRGTHFLLLIAIHVISNTLWHVAMRLDSSVMVYVTVDVLVVLVLGLLAWSRPPAHPTSRR